MNSIDDLLGLERIESNIFRGESVDLNTGQVYGGQVLGQAILAAQHTCEMRSLHSVHAYFLRRGDVTAPIVYEVDRSRDGRSFGARRVVAIQHGRPIFTLSASFQVEEEGLEYEKCVAPAAMPEIPPPLQLEPELASVRPSLFCDIRPVPDELLGDPNKIQWWLKPVLAPGASEIMHRAAFAYMSDLGLLGTTLLPHGYTMGKDRKRRQQEIVLASIDHAIWYHRPFNVDSWLLYECAPISTSGGRGLATGSLYAADGQLLATTMQEGLIRKRSN